MRALKSGAGFIALSFLMASVGSSQSTPIATQTEIAGFTTSNPNQTKVTTNIIPTNGTSLNYNGVTAQVVVYYTSQQGEQPSQIACTGGVSGSSSFCYWDVDTYGQYWVQAVFGGIYDPDTGQLEYAPSSSQIYHVVGGPDGVTISGN